jgi:hypothetical protein
MEHLRHARPLASHPEVTMYGHTDPDVCTRHPWKVAQWIFHRPSRVTEVWGSSPTSSALLAESIVVARPRARVEQKSL